MASTASASASAPTTAPVVSTDYSIKVDLQDFIEDINNKTQEALVKLAEKVIDSLTDIEKFLNEQETQPCQLITFTQAVSLYDKFTILAKSFGFDKIITNKKFVNGKVETLTFIKRNIETENPELTKLINAFIENSNILLETRAKFSSYRVFVQPSHLNDDLKKQISDLVESIGSNGSKKKTFNLFYMFEKKEKIVKNASPKGDFKKNKLASRSIPPHKTFDKKVQQKVNSHPKKLRPSNSQDDDDDD